MRWLSFSFLVFSYCGIHCQSTETSKDAFETTEFFKESNSVKQRETPSPGGPSLGSELKLERQDQLPNKTLTDISPFLLFPLLSFLLPEKSGSTKKLGSKNVTETGNGDPGPFLFFDLTFDTREIPLGNETRFPGDLEVSNTPGKLVSLKPYETRNERKNPRHPTDLSEEFNLLSGDDAFFDPFSIFPIRRKPERKLSRRKRQEKGRKGKNELKYFQDPFKEAFLETEKELREVNPISKFFQIVDGLFNGNEKREERVGKKEKPQLDDTAIVFDEVVKIGQVHVFDEGDDQEKRKGKRDSPRKIISAYHRNHFEDNPKKRLERNTKKKPHINHERKGISLVKVIRNNSSLNENDTTKLNLGQTLKPQESVILSKSLREDLTRNITEVLNRFLSLGEGEEFDWTERETLERRKNSRGKRQQKDEDFEEEYVEVEKKERQVANLNYLLVAITLPTVFVVALLLLICFSSFRVKGKICTKLFKPRQVFVVNSETSPVTSSKTQNV